MKRSTATRMMTVGIFLMATACGGEASEEVGGSHAAIINGTRSGRASVVMLVHFEGETARGPCTGTMIAKNLVLTARHCVSKTDSDNASSSVVSDYAAGDLFVFTGASAPSSATSKDNAAARGIQTVVYVEPKVDGQDVALVILDQDVDVPIARTAAAAPAVGDKLTVVGYGWTETGTAATTRRERTGRTVVSIDGPSFTLGESVCFGDSGGPAMDDGNVVVGVASGGGGGDGTGRAGVCVGDRVTTIFTSLASVRNIVDGALEAARTAAGK